MPLRSHLSVLVLARRPYLRADHADGGGSDAWLAQLLGKEHVVVLAALDGEAVIGGLVAYAFDKAERMRREIYIYDLAVAEAHRGRGVATALIGHLRGIAAACGAWVVFVQADPGDDPALAPYGKLGAREAALHFDSAVGEGPPLRGRANTGSWKTKRCLRA